MARFLYLLVGGGIGTIVRFLLSTWALQTYGPGFPFGTLVVNLLGCFIIGIFAGLPEGANSLTPTLRLILMTGFLGGLTTFSTYEYESFLLTKDGAIWKAMLNLGGSMILGFITVFIGYWVIRLVLGMMAKGV
jgi:fluoride exporter